MDQNLCVQLIESWHETTNVMHSTEEILQWMESLRKEIYVHIRQVPLEETTNWHYSAQDGGIVHDSRSFFQIKGIQRNECGQTFEQPIIVQNEIGYLGIICKEFSGTLYFLMQAKIEPGNVNTVQISPTIQATKSNFMRSHKGATPPYLEYFDELNRHEIIVDQIQSEQSSRFYQKRNRNIIIKINEEIPILPQFIWMTLGQIKQLMRHDNLINMDTRTVISCLPFSLRQYKPEDLARIQPLFTNEPFYRSVFFGQNGFGFQQAFHYINSQKMFDQTNTRLIDLYALKDWRMEGNTFLTDHADFNVIFCDIEIEGREVRRWAQPLLRAISESIFGLMCCIKDGCMLFLVQTISEVGCFDKMEFGPSVQNYPCAPDQSVVSELFFERLNKKQGILFSGILSEEGGRFYHEQNQNVILMIDWNDLPELPKGYFWMDYNSLNVLVQFNNYLNIQLRNLLALLSL